MILFPVVYPGLQQAKLLHSHPGSNAMQNVVSEGDEGMGRKEV